MPDSRKAALAGGVTLLVLLLGLMLPWMRDPRPVIASTPSLNGLSSYKEASLPPGRALCVAPVPLTPEVTKATFTVRSAGRPQPLVMTVRAPGFLASGRVPADAYAGSARAVTADLDRSPEAETRGTVCVRNAGTEPIAVAGTDEPRSLVPAVSRIGSRELPIDVGLTLYGEDRSVLARIADPIERAGAFAGLPAFFAWLIALAAIVLLPVLSIAAVARSFAAETRRAAPPGPR